MAKRRKTNQPPPELYQAPESLDFQLGQAALLELQNWHFQFEAPIVFWRSTVAWLPGPQLALCSLALIHTPAGESILELGWTRSDQEAHDLNQTFKTNWLKSNQVDVPDFPFTCKTYIIAGTLTGLLYNGSVLNFHDIVRHQKASHEMARQILTRYRSLVRDLEEVNEDSILTGAIRWLAERHYDVKLVNGQVELTTTHQINAVEFALKRGWLSAPS